MAARCQTTSRRNPHCIWTSLRGRGTGMQPDSESHIDSASCGSQNTSAFSLLIHYDQFWWFAFCCVIRTRSHNYYLTSLLCQQRRVVDHGRLSIAMSCVSSDAFWTTAASRSCVSSDAFWTTFLIFAGKQLEQQSFDQQSLIFRPARSGGILKFHF